ncbi:DsbA family protein [Virgisporangium ochraceum]|nr:DsbA family protein [Virgisporangium ochraceum]
MQFGDYQCPYCRQATAVLDELIGRHGHRLRYVWRHLPLDEIHPYARRAAHAAEAAARQGAFWAMHQRLLAADDLDGDALVAMAAAAGLDTGRFVADLDSPAVADRVDADLRSARNSGADGTPTFFLDGHRIDGSLVDIIAAVERSLAAPTGPKGR